LGFIHADLLAFGVGILGFEGVTFSLSFSMIDAAFNLFLRVPRRLLGRYFAARKP
jgi:hypothetical protein